MFRCFSSIIAIQESKPGLVRAFITQLCRSLNEQVGCSYSPGIHCNPWGQEGKNFIPLAPDTVANCETLASVAWEAQPLLVPCRASKQRRGLVVCEQRLHSPLGSCKARFSVQLSLAKSNVLVALARAPEEQLEPCPWELGWVIPRLVAHPLLLEPPCSLRGGGGAYCGVLSAGGHPLCSAARSLHLLWEKQ